MRKTVKCRYQHCLHESKDIPREEAVESGRFFYHPDCYKEKQNKDKIVRLFLDRVNSDVSVPMLRSMINRIVHDKGFSADYLLFGLTYYINHNISIHYPAGLNYVVANPEVQKLYNRIYGEKVQKPGFNITEDVDNGFVYRQQKKKTMDNFMEG